MRWKWIMRTLRKRKEKKVDENENEENDTMVSVLGGEKKDSQEMFVLDDDFVIQLDAPLYEHIKGYLREHGMESLCLDVADRLESSPNGRKC